MERAVLASVALCLFVLHGLSAEASDLTTRSVTVGNGGTGREDGIIGAQGDEGDAARRKLWASCRMLSSRTNTTDLYMYVWAGDHDQKDRDFLATILVRLPSPCSRHRRHRHGHGLDELLHVSHVPTKKNEPHHIGMNDDLIYTGGFASLLYDQDDVFLFDISGNRKKKPKYLRSLRSPKGGVVDEFLTMEDGSFFATCMGDRSGGSPGVLVEFDKHGNWVADLPRRHCPHDFNPHGLDYSNITKRLVTVDFIVPKSVLYPDPRPVTRKTVRIWDMATRKIIRTLHADVDGPDGLQEAKYVPGTKYAYASGTFTGRMYLIDAMKMKMKTVLRFGAGSEPHLFVFTPDGKRMFVALNTANKVAYVDTSDPKHPRVINYLERPGGCVGPHYLRLSPDGRFLFISNYYLQLEPVGIVHNPSDYLMWIARVKPNKLEYFRDIQVNFNTDFESGRARPHGFLLLPADARIGIHEGG